MTGGTDSVSSGSASEKASGSIEEDVSSSTGIEDMSCSGASTGASSVHSKEEIAAKETKHVRRSRAIFMTILLTSAATAGVLTYIFMSKEESKDFNNEVG
jgi:hypothetical protein